MIDPKTSGANSPPPKEDVKLLTPQPTTAAKIGKVNRYIEILWISQAWITTGCGDVGYKYRGKNPWEEGACMYIPTDGLTCLALKNKM